MRRLNTVLLVLGVAFLGYLIWSVGGTALWQQFLNLGWGVIPLIVCEGLGNLAHTAGWQQCIKGAREPVGLFSLFRMAMAGFSINYLTPSASLGGEVTKAALLTSASRGADAVSSVVLDKFCLAFAHLLFVIPGALVLLFTLDLAYSLRVAMMLGTVLLTGGIIGFMLVQKYGKLGGMVRWLAARRVGGRALERMAQRLSELDEKLKAFYRERPRNLAKSILWHLVGHSVGLFQTWLFFRMLDTPVLLAGVASASFLCLWFDLLTFAVPLNLGTLEGSRILALKAVGYTGLQGMTYGLSLRVAQVFWAMFGLVSYGLAIRNERIRAADSSDVTARLPRHCRMGEPHSAP